MCSHVLKALQTPSQLTTQQQNEEVSNRWPDFTDDDLLPQRDTPYEVSGGRS